MSRCKSKATKESDKGPPKELEMKEKLTKTELKKRKGKKNVWTEEGWYVQRAGRCERVGASVPGSVRQGEGRNGAGAEGTRGECEQALTTQYTGS